MQGQLIGNRNSERKARSLSRFKMGDTDGNIKKDTAPNSEKPDCQKLGGNTEAQAHFCCFYSQAVRSIFSSQTQATRTQGRPAFGYSRFLKAPCCIPYTFISKLDTVHNTGPLITPPGKCPSWFKVIFIFQFILALFLVFHDYFLHLITSERKK